LTACSHFGSLKFGKAGNTAFLKGERW